MHSVNEYLAKCVYHYAKISTQVRYCFVYIIILFLKNISVFHTPERRNVCSLFSNTIRIHPTVLQMGISLKGPFPRFLRWPIPSLRPLLLKMPFLIPKFISKGKYERLKQQQHNALDLSDMLKVSFNLCGNPLENYGLLG